MFVYVCAFAWTPHHLVLLKQDYFNDCQAMLCYMLLSVASSLKITVDRTMFTLRMGVEL